MAKQQAVWGLEIGHTALKAMKVRAGSDADTVVAESCDLIEYPMILSHPEADARGLVRDALEQFFARNQTKGDMIAIALPGQAGLARFFKPPPVKTTVLPDVVKFEAKQQIPFPLEEVIWDWQRLGGEVIDNQVFESEVAIFAMKREQVERSIQPLLEHQDDVHVVQLSPLATLNAVLWELPKHDVKLDPMSDAKEWIVILSMGTETTDVIVTNGESLWLRNIPIGGNQFTKILAKELKLTQAKAEQLKKHAMESDDPKKIFQVMRPVFNDFVNELQRSLRHFATLHRDAKIARFVMTGSPSKLPGLRQYVEQSLALPAMRLAEFKGLDVSALDTTPAFTDNVLGFPVAYGLGLQGLGKSHVRTSLVPPEMITDRIVRAKKPWAVAAVSLALAGMAAFMVMDAARVWRTDPNYTQNGQSWTQVFGPISGIKGKSDGYIAKDAELMGKMAHVASIGNEVAGNTDRKILWMEMMQAIQAALPKPKHPKLDVPARQIAIPDPKEYPFNDRTELYIKSVEAEFFPDLATWWTEPIKERYLQSIQGETAATALPGAPPADGTAPADPAAVPADAPSATGMEATPAETPPADGSAAAGDPAAGPTGPGWVIQLTGYHFHNTKPDGVTFYTDHSEFYVRQTLLRNLREGAVSLPVGAIEPGQPVQTAQFSMKDMGIEFPVLVSYPPIDRRYTIPNPAYVPPTATAASGLEGGMPTAAARPATPAAGAAAQPTEPPVFKVPRFDFVVQFVWKERLRTARLEERAARQRTLDEQAKAAEAAQLAAAEADMTARTTAGTSGDTLAPGEVPPDTAPAPDATASPPAGVPATPTGPPTATPVPPGVPGTVAPGPLPPGSAGPGGAPSPAPGGAASPPVGAAGSAPGPAAPGEGPGAGPTAPGSGPGASPPPVTAPGAGPGG